MSCIVEWDIPQRKSLSTCLNKLKDLISSYYLRNVQFALGVHKAKCIQNHIPSPRNEQLKSLRLFILTLKNFQLYRIMDLSIICPSSMIIHLLYGLLSSRKRATPMMHSLNG